MIFFETNFFSLIRIILDQHIFLKLFSMAKFIIIIVKNIRCLGKTKRIYFFLFIKFKYLKLGRNRNSSILCS